MARDGWLFVGPALVVAALAASSAWLGWIWAWPLTVLAILAAGFLAYFFRDPTRMAPDDARVVVAPADGKILVVAPLADGRTQIDTFLSVWDVHVNRAPIGGQVTSSEYRRGRFIPAMRPEAATRNERQDITVESSLGTVRFAQIAGVLARRIVCRVRLGDQLKTGDRIGMICFGSRMEVIIPPGTIATVRVGDRVRAGESIIARCLPVGRHGAELPPAA